MPGWPVVRIRPLDRPIVQLGAAERPCPEGQAGRSAPSTVQPVDSPELSFGVPLRSPPTTSLARALLVVGLLLGAAGDTAAEVAEPRRVFLWFPDGGPLPPNTPKICGGNSPPAYSCTFAPTIAECRSEIQRWLDRWYADFNLVFTYQQPSSGPFDTIIVSHEGAWCFADPRTTSQSPLPTCMPVESGWVATFQCGADARRCASIIAQEQAHLVGLNHTPSTTDVMNDLFLPDHDGFEDADNPVSGTQCRRPQNSYRLMLERLGPWPGGAKPAPEQPGEIPADGGAEPDGLVVGPADAFNEDGMTELPEVDAAPDVPPWPAEAPAGSSSGCGCTLGGAAGTSPAGAASLLVLLAAALTLRPLGRRARRRR